MRNSPWLVTTYLIVILFGILVALPNVIPQSTLDRLPSWLPHSRVSLGLDLRGGSHLVLEVDRTDLINERVQSLLQDARRVLRDKNIGTSAIRRAGEAVSITLRDPAQRDAAVTELQTLANPVGFGTTVGGSDLAPPSSRALKSSASVSTRLVLQNRPSSASAPTASWSSFPASRIRPAFASFSAPPQR